MREHIEQLTNLPTLPQMAARLMEVIGGDGSSARDVAAVVRQDVSLSAKILRLANSAFYGMPRTVANIADAVVLLGTKVIGTLVLSLTVFDMFPKRSAHTAFDRREFWRHCLYCGLIARAVAHRDSIKGVGTEDIFCAGLLHDIGKIVMDQYLQEDMALAAGHARVASLPFHDAEKQVLDYTHAEVAEWLISRWNLPEVVHYPIVHHHSPAGSEGAVAAVYICHLADHLAYDQRLDRPSAGTAPALDPHCLNRLSLSEGDTAQVVEMLPEEVAKAGIFQDLFTAH